MEKTLAAASSLAIALICALATTPSVFAQSCERIGDTVWCEGSNGQPGYKTEKIGDYYHTEDDNGRLSSCKQVGNKLWCD